MTVKGETCQYGTELCFGAFVGVCNLVPVGFEFTLEDFDKAIIGDIVLGEKFAEIKIVVLLMDGIAQESFLLFDVFAAFRNCGIIGCFVMRHLSSLYNQ